MRYTPFNPLLPVMVILKIRALCFQIQDAQEQGTRYSFNLDLHNPTIQVPQHSESTNVIVLKLGDLSIKNYFEDTEVGGVGGAPGVVQKWDHIYLNLDNMHLLRSVVAMFPSVIL